MKNRERVKSILAMVVPFFLLVLAIMGLTFGSTHLDDVNITDAKEDEGNVNLEIDTVLSQKDGDATNICVEMVFLDGNVKENAECIKVVDLLEENHLSRLHWSVILHPQNGKCVVYLFIWSSLGENEYSRIEMTEYEGKWEPFHRELEPVECLKVYCHSRLDKIQKTLEIIFKIFEDR